MSIESFDASPPDLSYGDPSFFIGVQLEKDKYHNECTTFARKLVTAGALVALSPLGLDEIWFAMLKLLATHDFSERTWQQVLKAHPDLVKQYAVDIERTHQELLAFPLTKGGGLLRRGYCCANAACHGWTGNDENLRVISTRCHSCQHY
jgi:hypothetical protein